MVADNWVSLVVFTIVSLMGPLWGVSAKGSVFAFPAVLGGTSLAYFVPQAWAIIPMVDQIGPSVYTFGLAFFSACLVSGYLGYLIKPGRVPFPKEEIDYDRAFYIGTVLLLIGNVFYLILNLRLGGLFAYFYAQSGGYAIEWRGLPVYLVNANRLLGTAGLALGLIGFMGKPSLTKAVTLIFLNVYLISNVVLRGRRSILFALAVFVAISAHYIRGWRPPAWLVFAGLLGAAAVVILFPAYRVSWQLGAPDETTQVEAPMEIASQFFLSQEGAYPLAYALKGMSTAWDESIYDFGAVLWNGAISLYVPGGLIGRDLKASVLINTGSISDAVYEQYLDDLPYYMTPTGPAAVFYSFWLFGVLVYFFAGRVFRTLWLHARVGKPEAIVLSVAISLLPAFLFYGAYFRQIFRFLPIVIIALAATKAIKKKKIGSRGIRSRFGIGSE